ncbi:MAG: type I-A CRISPR-associated protein Cas5a [Sulfolobales archaeon]
MYYIKVLMRLSWGFTSRKLFSSKSRESYIVPPPTTLIGALSYGYARLNKIPEEDGGLSSAERIRRLIYSVHEKVNAPVIQYADISKIWWYRAREAAAKYDAVALGKAYKGLLAGKPDLEVLYIVRDQDQARVVASSAHSIIRIGGSYGLVSVENVEYGSLSCASEEEASTLYSFWEDLILDGLPSDILVEEVIDYRKTSISGYVGVSLRRRVYPYSKSLMKPVEVRVKVDPKKAMICRGGEEVVVVER